MSEILFARSSCGLLRRFRDKFLTTNNIAQNNSMLLPKAKFLSKIEQLLKQLNLFLLDLKMDYIDVDISEIEHDSNPRKQRILKDFAIYYNIESIISFYYIYQTIKLAVQFNIVFILSEDKVLVLKSVMYTLKHVVGNISV